MVEIVEMLVVAEQHGVDGADSFGRQRRTRGLPQKHSPLVVARRIEGGIGHEFQPLELDENRRPPDEGQRRFQIVHALRPCSADPFEESPRSLR